MKVGMEEYIMHDELYHPLLQNALVDCEKFSILLAADC
jgi:hypothetical protein